MKLIIAGGRDYQFTNDDMLRLDKIHGHAERVTEVVSGGAKGADRCGEQWAIGMQLPIKRFPADWEKHGKRAGPLRNAEMAAYANAVALFPGGIGTQSMFNEATKAGITIYDYRNP